MRRVSALLLPAKGLPATPAPVSGSTRSTLPPSDVRLWGVVPMAASPVPIQSRAEESIISRQPAWRPLLDGRPDTIVATR